MKNQTVYLLFAALLLTVSVFGQNGLFSDSSNLSETSLGLHRTIELEMDSKSVEIVITIKPKEPKFELLINTLVSEGKLTIEVYDPANTKQGSFTVGTQLDSGKKETVRGNIEKSLTEPLAGNWKVKIIPSGATALIEIKTLTSN